MPCDVPLKVMHTTYCHVESDPSGVKERRMKGSQRDTGQTNEAKDRTLDVYSLQCRSHNKEFQGHQDEKKRNHNPEVPLFPLLTNTTFPPHLFVFFPPLFLSLSLSSRCVVSLIGRQTACKCSNLEKSPGALVIGCALQHSSQSIKARWAPVNSFSLLLLWLWYRHIDSNFALNPSTTVLLLPLCLFHSSSLHFSFHFQSPRIHHSIATQKAFLNNSHSGLVLLSLFFLFLGVLTLKSLRASSPLTHLALSS